MASVQALPLRIGARTILTIRRALAHVPYTLDDALAAQPPTLPPLGAAQGYRITSLPACLLSRLDSMSFAAFVRQAYPRRYVALDRDFDAYLAGFSSKSRATLKRKLRRFADRSGGSIAVRSYHRPEQVAEFHDRARSVSASSYQERSLDAGLPDGPDALAEITARAALGAMRAWLLFLDGTAIAYLYAPANGDTLLYAHLGYDPAFADLSPGTVLQIEALRDLMTERRFARFDFTEGDGQHKRQFATGSVDCVDVLLLRRTAANLALGWTLTAFDAAVAHAKRVLAALRLDALARRVTR